MQFSMSGAILFECLEFFPRVFVYIVGRAVSSHTALCLDNPYLTIGGLDDVIRIEVISAERSTINYAEEVFAFVTVLVEVFYLVVSLAPLFEHYLGVCAVRGNQDVVSIVI